jgi:hypothetical protein
METLLRDWDTSRNFRRQSAFEALTDQTKERLFELVAGHFCVNDFSFVLPKPMVLELVSDFCSRVGLKPDDAGSILHEIDAHHGILEQFSQDDYSFSHTSFQEYLAARYIIAKRLEHKAIQENCDNPDWHAIIEFIVAMADDPSDLLRSLMQRSDLSQLQNWPPMGRRTSLLHLLYRCMATRPFVPHAVKQEVMNHLVKSQVHIARIYAEGGVYPAAQLLPDGIAHPYFWLKSKRETLSDALFPYRRFANEVLNTPILEYADAVLRVLPEIEAENTKEELRRNTLILNLVVPLARTRKAEVVAILNRMTTRAPQLGLRNIVARSLETLDC